MIVVGGVVAVGVVVVVWEYLELPGSIVWRARRFQKRESARLLRASRALRLVSLGCLAARRGEGRFRPCESDSRGE